MIGGYIGKPIGGVMRSDAGALAGIISLAFTTTANLGTSILVVDVIGTWAAYTVNGSIARDDCLPAAASVVVGSATGYTVDGSCAAEVVEGHWTAYTVTGSWATYTVDGHWQI